MGRLTRGLAAASLAALLISAPSLAHQGNHPARARKAWPMIANAKVPAHLHCQEDEVIWWVKDLPGTTVDLLGCVHVEGRRLEP